MLVEVIIELSTAGVKRSRRIIACKLQESVPEILCLFGVAQQSIGSTALPSCTIPVRQNCHRASITRTKRKIFTRTYPVRLVQPDGSSFTIRYKQPQRILVMPENLDLLTLSEKERRYRRMDPPKRVIVQDYDDEGFSDARSEYIERMKKK